MTRQGRWTAELGDLVVAAFDTAALRSSDPGEVSRLATAAVARLLERAHRFTLGAAAPRRRHPAPLGRHAGLAGHP